MKCRTCGNDLQGNEYNCPFCGSCVDYTQAVEQAKAGREEGFTFLYENTYRNKLYIAMKYMKNEQDAMDVLQDAYIKAFARLDSLQDANAFPGWMSTIVAHTALNALQKKQAVLFSDLQNENDEGDVFEYNLEDENMSTQPEMACTVQETQDMVHELIDSLSDEQRVCVLMFHLEGYSIRDIATILGCSENTVKSRLNYGRKNIKAKAEELQKKGYKLYSYTPMCLLVYLLMAERGNMIVTHVFEQMAGLGGNVSAGIIHGGAMQMAGNVTGGAAQIAGGTAGQMTGGASQIAGGTAGQVAGGTAQTGAAGSAAGAVEGGKAIAATVGKQAFIKTVTGKIVIAVASVALVGGAVGAGFAYKYSQDKKKDQNATTEAASEANDDTVTTEVTAETEATTEVTTETSTEITTEAAIDESLYKAAYKEVLESYKTQIDNYYWQYEYDYSTKTAKEEQTPITFADVTGDDVPEMILIRSEQNEASIAQMDIYSFDGTKAKRIFGTDMEEYGGWDINAASGTSYYLFTTKKGTLYAYSGFGDESYTDSYIKFTVDDSGMLQKSTTWTRKKGPNDDYSATVVTCQKNGSEITEDKYNAQVEKLQKNFHTLLMYNGQGKDKAKEVLGTLDDTAMTYDEAMEYLGKITQKKTDKTASDKKQEKSADKKEISAGNAGEVAVTLPEDLPEEFILTSGVGAWGAGMDIKPDGTFTASYYDSNYEGRSTSSGSGSFKNIKQVDKYTYTMELDTLKYDDEIGKVVANDNGYKTTFTELYGIAGGTTFTVYLPGAPTADMPDGMKNWLGFHYYNVPIPDALDCYAIYNVDKEKGYFSTGLQ